MVARALPPTRVQSAPSWGESPFRPADALSLVKGDNRARLHYGNGATESQESSDRFAAWDHLAAVPSGDYPPSPCSLGANEAAIYFIINELVS
jgi:hypothetical protein